MIDINKVNNKLKYTEFYDIPKDEWNWPHFYKNLDKNIATNYNFLYTFKDKIKFAYLFNNHNIKLKYIKNFIEYYDRIDWSVLFNQNRITAQFLNKYYKKIIVPIPLDLIKKFNEQGKLKQEVVDYAIHHQITSIIKENFITVYD